MIGVIAIIVWVVCWFVRSSRETHFDSYRRQQYPNPYVYTDTRGRMHLKSNNQIVYDYKAPWNGHVYIKDKHGNVLFDMTERLEAEGKSEPNAVNWGYFSSKRGGPK